MSTLTSEELDLQLASGRLHVQHFGAPEAPLVLCLPGLWGTMRSFDTVGRRLGSDRRQVVALDLRGRGKSEATAPGSYGVASHVQDVLAVATALEATRFSLIGHSFGAVVALQVARLAPDRLERLVLVDLCGTPEPSTLPLIQSGLEQLGVVWPSVDAYVAQVQQMGLILPWSETWRDNFDYDLQPVDGGVRSRAVPEAVGEDLADLDPTRLDLYATWPDLRMPVLLLRATRQLLPGLGFMVTAVDRDRFAAEVSGAEVVEIEANHFGIIAADAAVEAIASFLGTGRATS